MQTIVIATPLYPPDTGGAAWYVKELARRLCNSCHVVVVSYGRLPEGVAGVRIRTTDKRLPLPIRMPLFLLALLREARRADVLYIENGPSVELPAGIAARLLRVPLVMHLGDSPAHSRAKNRIFFRTIERFAMKKARRIVSDTPRTRPEILPFAPYPEQEFAAYERSWSEHLEILVRIFRHAAY